MTGLATRPANPRKTCGIRPLGPIDVAALAAAVRAIPETVWTEEDAHKPNRFDVLGQTRHIVFRFISDARDWRRSYDCPAWPAWQERVAPVLAAAVEPYGYAQGVFPRIMLARLPAGAFIQPHVDANPAARWPHKIHIPLITAPGVVSHFGGADYHFPAGVAVEVDNLGPHWVHNRSACDRVHLIFEYYDPDQPAPAWMERSLPAEARP